VKTTNQFAISGKSPLGKYLRVTGKIHTAGNFVHRERGERPHELEEKRTDVPTCCAPRKP